MAVISSGRDKTKRVARRGLKKRLRFVIKSVTDNEKLTTIELEFVDVIFYPPSMNSCRFNSQTFS